MIDLLASQMMEPASRKPRGEITLNQEPGLYALFLAQHSELPGIPNEPGTLIYIGKASGAGGLKSRCHFNGGTRNHSPRKSLAVLLELTLGLAPRPILNADGTYKTWALDQPS